MHLTNRTTGQLERLQLLGCTVVIREGKAHATVTGLVVARFNSIIHALRVRYVRKEFSSQRAIDRVIEPYLLANGKSKAPHEYYACTYQYAKFMAAEALPSRWFNRA